MLIKRLVDFNISTLFLVFLSPLFLLIALTIWLTSGRPIFFRQPRLGRDGLPFDIFKFRTMIVVVPDVRNPDGSAYSAADDPRVTPVGRFLRSTSLDELPQLFNVIKGQMSLVGPRPDQVDQLHYYTEAERAKLQVKPGITGLAQISGRNELSWEQRKQLDLEYVKHQSLWLDFRILLKTIPYVLARRGLHTADAGQGEPPQ